MRGRVVFGLNGTQGNAVRLAFTRRPAVEKLRIAGLWRGDHPNLSVEHAGAIDSFLDLLVAVGQGDTRHRKRPAAKCPKDSIQRLMVAGYAEFPLGFAIPGFELVVVDRPVTTDTECTLQPKVAREKSRTIPSPRPRAAAHHPVIPGFEGMLRLWRIVVVLLLPFVPLILEFQLRVFRHWCKESARQIQVRRVHVAAIALTVHHILEKHTLGVGDGVITRLEDDDAVTSKL